MVSVLRHFDRDEVDRLVPKVDITPQEPPQQSQQPASPQQGGGQQPQMGAPMVPPSVMPGPGGRVM
jgi:hypothetical protein